MGPAERAEAQAVLDFASTAHYPIFLRWLEDEAMRPVKISDGRDMVVSAARQNSFLEVRQHLLSKVKIAQSVIGEGHV